VLVASERASGTPCSTAPKDQLSVTFDRFGEVDEWVEATALCQVIQPASSARAFAGSRQAKISRSCSEQGRRGLEPVVGLGDRCEGGALVAG